MDRQTESSTLSPIVFDSDILIECGRGSHVARDFLVRHPHHNRFLSSVVWMELLQGCRTSEEMNFTKQWLNDHFIEIWHVDAQISKRAAVLIEMHAASHGLRIVDAFIAATALEKGARLATGNVKHFKGIAGLKLVPFRL